MRSETIQTTTPSGFTFALDPQIKMLYPLTPCCKASAKGMESGVGCRGCYEYIDPRYGDALILTEDLDEAVERISWWVMIFSETTLTQADARAQAKAALTELTRKAGWISP